MLTPMVHFCPRRFDQSISDAVCHQWTVQTSKGIRFTREVVTLLSNKKLNCFLIALLSHFYVGILGIIPALQVRAFLRQQVAKTHKKKISCPHLKVIYTQFLYLMECPGSIFSVILTSHSWKPSI